MKSFFACALVLCFAVAVAGCDSGGGEAAAIDVDKSDVEKYNEMMEQSMAGFEEGEEAAKAAK
jgi:hypothetical protein